jgi:hypothetical protein
MKKWIITASALAVFGQQLLAFCGFYVSKADGTLQNKTSQVILVRDGDRNIITMYNDFRGNLKDFAMVVPVPVVLQKQDVKVVDNGIFQRLNDYSAPRLVEYYDSNPCMAYENSKDSNIQLDRLESVSLSAAAPTNAIKRKVTIEAQYTVGEYDILILSAKESNGLKIWLNENGYKIPPGAEEVLDPYIKSNLKFFVVKVNMAAKLKSNNQFLRPLQIRFVSPKFMLPIRLGMANANGDQDMIVYAFTKTGRVETTNYRTVEVPTDKNIPLFVQPNFGRFYGDVFENTWKKEGQNAAFLEYAWDVSPANYVKCDPCVSNPPDYNDLVQAGVWWIKNDDYENYVNEYDGDKGKVFFTRLHVRYNRASFPQDLSFQVTPNAQSFQARYIITHPATGSLTCAAAKQYLKALKERRKKEMKMLAQLTGKTVDEWQEDLAATKDEQENPEAMYATLAMALPKGHEKNNYPAGLLVLSLAVVGGAGIMRWKGLI